MQHDAEGKLGKGDILAAIEGLVAHLGGQVAEKGGFAVGEEGDALLMRTGGRASCEEVGATEEGWRHMLGNQWQSRQSAVP